MTIAHSALTGSSLHEPKGAASAASGQVYVANGSGSGNWSDISSSSFTGMIADFPWPVAQAGWLECNGSDVSTSTYAALYAVMSIQTSGTRTNGSAIITSIPTTNLRAGYYLFGTGFAANTTILTVDSPTQVTVSNAAGSTGTNPLAVSPWFLNTGTIRLPDLSTAGRFRRSRTGSTAVGQVQVDQNKAHTHGVSGTTAAGGSHTPTGTFTGSNATVTVNSTLTDWHRGGISDNYSSVGGFGTWNSPTRAQITSSGSYTPAGTLAMDAVATHTHGFSATSDSSGNSEARPLAIVLMTCVKT